MIDDERGVLLELESAMARDVPGDRAQKEASAPRRRRHPTTGGDRPLLKAFIKPVRRLWYNLTITAVPVVVALIVSALETLGLAAGTVRLEGGAWNAVALLNGNIGALGFMTVGVFGASWLSSSLVYRLKRYDEVGVAGSDDMHRSLI